MNDRALVFDMDGVLIDSEPLWRRAEVACFGEVGLELDERDCLPTTGLRIDEACADWFERALARLRTQHEDAGDAHASAQEVTP